MQLSGWNRRYLKPILILILLVALVGAFSGCEDFGQYPPPTPPAEQPEPEKVVRPTFIGTEDRAILAVYEHLLNQAVSHEAKQYLAEFYAASNNWGAEAERFKDGSNLWYVSVNMTSSEGWEQRPYWQEAGWFVFRDGEVIPSQRIQANALRIEADLQELSLQSGTVVN